MFPTRSRPPVTRPAARSNMKFGDLPACDPPDLPGPSQSISGCNKGATMKATQKLHELGQSLWLDNITRDLLTSGTLERYINELSVTGLTSNPTIFDHAVAHSHSYDAEIMRLAKAGKSQEELFFELAIQDLTKAADMFAPIFKQT